MPILNVLASCALKCHSSQRQNPLSSNSLGLLLFYYYSRKEGRCGQLAGFCDRKMRHRGALASHLAFNNSFAIVDTTMNQTLTAAFRTLFALKGGGGLVCRLPYFHLDFRCR